jgi:hypothetical protein
LIDTTLETLISLTEAASVLPRRRGGRSVNVSCLYRWTKRGCKGIVLESVQVGATRCTSREALGRFFERLTRASLGDGSLKESPTPGQRNREQTLAKARLRAAGIL